MPREETVDFADSSRLKSQFPSELTEDGSLPPRLLSSELGSYSHGFLANLPGRARAFPPGVWSFWPIPPSGRDSPGSEPPRLCPAILASVRAPWLWPEAKFRSRKRPCPPSPQLAAPRSPPGAAHPPSSPATVAAPRRAPPPYWLLFPFPDSVASGHGPIRTPGPIGQPMEQSIEARADTLA